MIKKVEIKKFINSIILFPVVIFLLANSGKFIPVIDHINLLFHEGGHGIFRIFGKFIYTLGGSLMQIIIPSLFIYYFYTNRKKAGTQISLVYLGENILNISAYVADARKMNLPLLGGNRVYHDWNYLLKQTGLLEYDEIISKILYLIAVVVFGMAILYPVLKKEYQKADVDLNL